MDSFFCPAGSTHHYFCDFKMADQEKKAASAKTSVVMKVEGPSEEDEVKEDNERNERKEESSDIDPSKICSPSRSRPVLCSPRLSSTNTMSQAANSSSHNVLRPSQLSSNLSNNRGQFSLNPSRLNPFLKSFPNDGVKNGEDSKVVNGETPKFVPLLNNPDRASNTNNASSTGTSHVPSISLSETSNFVFGQNLQERVIADSKTDEIKPSTSLSSNGSTDMLFSNAIGSSSEAANTRSRESKSLSESAREYEESRAVKRKYDEVEVKTGEEEETNILQISCKLFAFDKVTGSWQERGRGNLRLNDYECSDDGGICTQSRLVFRTSGSLRVILNTKIWSEMTIQEASKKSIRLTAMDSNGEIKVFLVMAGKDDINKLYEELDVRVKKEIERQKHKSDTEETKRKKIDGEQSN